MAKKKSKSSFPSSAEKAKMTRRINELETWLTAARRAYWRKPEDRKVNGLFITLSAIHKAEREINELTRAKKGY